jgi:cellulose synthase operon protein YhjQ
MSNEKRTEAKANGEAVILPEDVATLYSWANLHGAKYRDFSANRQAARSQAHERANAEPAAKEAAKTAPAEPAARGAWEELIAGAPVAAPIPQAGPAPSTAAAPSGLHAEIPLIETRPTTGQQDNHDSTDINRPPVSVQSPSRIADLPFAFEPPQPPRHEYVAPAPRPEIPWPAQEKTGSRWYALNSILNQPDNTADRRPSPVREFKIPVLAVFSLAGGVGKTGIVATLGRALAARGEKVLLVDTNSYGLLPLYYGANDVRPGTVRTFSDATARSAVQLLSLDVERYDNQHPLVDDIIRSSQGTHRVLIDLATGSSSLTRQILRLSPQVLVPLVPDISSLVSLQAVESFFARQPGAENRVTEPLYVLNGFDSSLPLHHDLREALRQRLGARLLSFTLRRTPALSEALAEGMTVLDYSPGALIVEDYAALSTWIRNLSAPAGSGLRGQRWSEQ